MTGFTPGFGACAKTLGLEAKELANKRNERKWLARGFGIRKKPKDKFGPKGTTVENIERISREKQQKKKEETTRYERTVLFQTSGKILPSFMGQKKSRKKTHQIV